MAKRPRVRQYAIADHLGLSRSTVSKVFARRGDVSEETRTRVMEAAKQLGYSIRSDTKSEAKSLTLGMLVRLGLEASANYRPDYLDGVSRAAMANNVSLLVHCVPDSQGEEEFVTSPDLQPAAMKSGILDGVLLSGTWSEEGIHRLAELMPAVAITFGAQPSNLDLIEPDTMSAMKLLTDHLTESGHRRIAFVGLCPDQYWSVERYAGFVAAMSSKRLTVPNKAVLSVSDKALRDPDCLSLWANYAKQVKGLIDGGFTAIACCSDWAAFHLHWGLEELGVKIPEDVSLVGFDNHEDFTLGRPPVTSISIPRSTLAEIAVLRLVDRCRSPSAPTRRTLYRCEFVDNGTVAAPREVV